MTRCHSWNNNISKNLGNQLMKIILIPIHILEVFLSINLQQWWDDWVSNVAGWRSDDRKFCASLSNKIYLIFLAQKDQHHQGANP